MSTNGYGYNYVIVIDNLDMNVRRIYSLIYYSILECLSNICQPLQVMRFLLSGNLYLSKVIAFTVVIE